MSHKVTGFNKRFFLMLATALTVIALTASLWLPGQAEGPTTITAAAVSSQINYQGVLQEGGSPVTGNRNFTFRFYTDAACATLVGSPIAMTGVAVNNGLFSVKLDVDQALFSGQGLWLGVDVGSTGSNTACEEMVPVPYALSLRPGAVIVGSSADAPILSVTNTYSPTAGFAASADGAYIGVSGVSQTGAGVYGTSTTGEGVAGSSSAGVGVTGLSFNGNGGVFSTADASAFGLVARNLAGGTAARFEGGVSINGGNVVVDGEVYAKSLHTTDASGATTSGVTTSGDGTFKSVTVPQTGGGTIETTADGLVVKPPSGDPLAKIRNTGDSTFRSVSTGYPPVFKNATITADGVALFQALAVIGAKSALVTTASYGQRKLYADESAEIYFFDRGGGQLVNGVAVIHLDPVWLETVTIDADHPMRVQVTLTGDCNGVYVAEKTTTSFIVRELRGGTSNATFDWEVAAKRKGYEAVRLAPVVENP